MQHFAVCSKKDGLKKIKSFPHWETISLVGVLLSLYYFTAIPPLSINAGTELFEQANHGMLANDLLAWGRFPMINSFDAHTLYSSLGCILYGVVNGDILGASYFGYSFVWLLPAVICTFLIYKNVFDKYFAFLLIVLAPYAFTSTINMGVISIVALLYAVRKKTFSSFLWLLLSVVIGLVYNIPSGYSYGIASVFIILIILIRGMVKERKYTSELNKFIKALGVFITITGGLYIGICLQQHLNPIKRALEFISIAASTNNWTYATLGDSTTSTFGLLYSILPLIVIVCLAWLVTHFKNEPLYYVSSALLLAYVFNITRTLQRHSLAENNVTYVIGPSLLGIAMFLAWIAPKDKRTVVVVSSVLVLTVIFNINTLQNANTVAKTALETVCNSSIYYDGPTEKVTRVNLTPPMEEHKAVLNMINSIIPEGETYLDMTGNTMLYALSGREKPVYANQSVTELSGEYSQKRLVEEVEEDYEGICDFALVNLDFPAINIDGVNGRYRYYVVFEYLYDNYRPLCKTGNYVLWVRNSRYDDFKFTDEVQIDKISFDPPVCCAPVTDVNWTNGILNGNPNHMLFARNEAEDLINAKVVYSSSDSANVTNIIVNEDWVRIETDKDASIFADGITAADVQPIISADYDYYGLTHSTDIGQIPYLWGQYDKKKSWNNALVQADYTTQGEVGNETQRNAKYVLITLETETDGSAVLAFQNAEGDNVSEFHFTLKKGTNRYMIRCSTDWWWNRNVIVSYSVAADVEIAFDSINFLVGD